MILPAEMACHRGCAVCYCRLIRDCANACLGLAARYNAKLVKQSMTDAA